MRFWLPNLVIQREFAPKLLTTCLPSLSYHVPLRIVRANNSARGACKEGDVYHRDQLVEGFAWNKFVHTLR